MNEPPSHHPRQAMRFRAVEGAVAVQGAKIGQIIDISRSGLAFQYIALEEEESLHEPLRIICNHDLFNLPAIPSQEVYDRPLPSSLSFSDMRMRRRGLLFHPLEAPQEEALLYFLAQHTRGPA